MDLTEEQIVAIIDREISGLKRSLRKTLAEFENDLGKSVELKSAYASTRKILDALLILKAKIVAAKED